MGHCPFGGKDQIFASRGKPHQVLDVLAMRVTTIDRSMQFQADQVDAPEKMNGERTEDPPAKPVLEATR